MTVPGSANGPNRNEPEEPRVVVRDRRKIDPETGQLRTAAADAGPQAAPAPGEPVPPSAAVSGATATAEDELRAQLDERTADLQRLQAEYANYRRRVERDRQLAATNAKAELAAELIGVLDDIDRADAHGDLTGAFKAVADKFVTALQKAGLEPFGHEGDEFDPTLHEAVQHDTSPDVSGPTVTAVLRRGYRFGDKVVRFALVAVTDHEAPAETGVEQETESAGESS